MIDPRLLREVLDYDPDTGVSARQEAVRENFGDEAVAKDIKIKNL